MEKGTTVVAGLAGLRTGRTVEVAFPAGGETFTARLEVVNADRNEIAVLRPGDDDGDLLYADVVSVYSRARRDPAFRSLLGFVVSGLRYTGGEETAEERIERREFERARSCR